MDEVHNLVHPPPGTDKRLLKRLERMRNALYSAKGSVIVGLTATPFVKDEKDGKELLRMIKGEEYKNSPTNEGFVSYFNTLPKSIYPEMRPGTAAMNVIRVQMEGANLKKYEEKAKQRKMSSDPKRKIEQIYSLMNYCNMAGYYTQASRGDFRHKLRTDPIEYATKLDYIAKEALAHTKKCAILIHRRLGFDALRQVITGLDPRNRGRVAYMGKPRTIKEKEHNPTLAAFNADNNYRGEKIRVLVLDAETYGEGIDLIGVRFFYIAHPAPSYALYKQWVGRVLRACAYDKLNPGERNVTIQMYIAKTDKKDKPTADEIMLEILRAQTMKMEDAMRDVFGVVATDRIVLGHP